MNCGGPYHLEGCVSIDPTEHSQKKSARTLRSKYCETCLGERNASSQGARNSA